MVVAVEKGRREARREADFSCPIITELRNFFSKSGKLLLVPYTKDFERITQF